MTKLGEQNSKSGKQKLLFRPLQKLIPFKISENRGSEDQGESEEFEDNKAEDENQKQQVEETNDENNQNRTRPKRKAAIEGQNKRRLRKQYS